MSRKKRKLTDAEKKIKEIHRIAGRIDLPVNKRFKDKSKYVRKEKYRGIRYDDAPFFITVIGKHDAA